MPKYKFTLFLPGHIAAASESSSLVWSSVSPEGSSWGAHQTHPYWSTGPLPFVLAWGLLHLFFLNRANVLFQLTCSILVFNCWTSDAPAVFPSSSTSPKHMGYFWIISFATFKQIPLFGFALCTLICSTSSLTIALLAAGFGLVEFMMADWISGVIFSQLTFKDANRKWWKKREGYKDILISASFSLGASRGHPWNQTILGSVLMMNIGIHPELSHRCIPNEWNRNIF